VREDISMNVKKMLCEENVGGYDLALRAAVGTLTVIILALGLASPPWTWVLAVLAFGSLYTSITRHCTPYGLFGINTARK